MYLYVDDDVDHKELGSSVGRVGKMCDIKEKEEFSVGVVLVSFFLSKICLLYTMYTIHLVQQTIFHEKMIPIFKYGRQLCGCM